mgnify:CR=1 FL=1
MGKPLVAICEICGHPLGVFDPDEIASPPDGTMFSSIDPHHDYPAPFASSLDWEWMRCPMCRKRPFKTMDSIKTPQGDYDIWVGEVWDISGQVVAK